MKGVIIGKKRNSAIVLKSNGTYERRRDTGAHEIGDEIDMATGSILRFSLGKTIIAAVLAILIGTSGFSYYAYAMPASEVSLDINPSVNLVLNKADKVIKTEAMNEDAELLLKEIDVKGYSVEEATEIILNEAKKMGFITEGQENGVVISVSSKNENNQERVTKRLENKFGQETPIENPNLERVERAKEMGITPGKLVIMEKLQALDPEFETDKNVDMSIQEIQAKIKELKKENKENNGKGNAYGKNKDKSEENDDDDDDNEIAENPNDEDDGDDDDDDDADVDDGNSGNNGNNNGNGGKSSKSTGNGNSGNNNGNSNNSNSGNNGNGDNGNSGNNGNGDNGNSGNNGNGNSNN